MKFNDELIQEYRKIYKEFEKKHDIKTRQAMKKFIYSFDNYSDLKKDKIWEEIIR